MAPKKPSTQVLDSYQVLVSAFCEFLTVAIHTILYERDIYPRASFLNARKYNCPVRQNRHPQVCKWIQDAVAAVEGELLKVCMTFTNPNAVSAYGPSVPFDFACCGSVNVVDSLKAHYTFQVKSYRESSLLLFVSCRRTETLSPPYEAPEIAHNSGPSFLLSARHHYLLSPRSIVSSMNNVIYSYHSVNMLFTVRCFPLVCISLVLFRGRKSKATEQTHSPYVPPLLLRQANKRSPRAPSSRPP